MDRFSAAIARLSSRPYRTTTDTTLEVMLRHGPLAPIGRSPLRSVIVGLVGLGGLAVAARLVLADPNHLVRLLVILPVVAALVWTARREVHRTLGTGSFPALRAHLASYPIPIVGHPARWLADGLVRLGRLDLVLREPHPLAEATVRLAEPDAALSWPSPTILRVEPRWGRDAHDLPRLDRLVLLLGMYRDELGIEHIELGSG